MMETDDEDYRYESTRLESGCYMFNLLRRDKPMMYKSVLINLENDKEFRYFFTRMFRKIPFSAYVWETNPVSYETCDKIPFKFVVTQSSTLEVTPNWKPFSEHFRYSRNRHAASFINLGGDATLIAPLPKKSYFVERDYAHIGNYIKNSSPDEVDEFWKETSTKMAECLFQNPRKPLWLSTAGHGVAWLHARIDSHPKYYSYYPFKTFSKQNIQKAENSFDFGKRKYGAATTSTTKKDTKKETKGSDHIDNFFDRNWTEFDNHDLRYSKYSTKESATRTSPRQNCENKFSRFRLSNLWNKAPLILVIILLCFFLTSALTTNYVTGGTSKGTTSLYGHKSAPKSRFQTGTSKYDWSVIEEYTGHGADMLYSFTYKDRPLTCSDAINSLQSDPTFRDIMTSTFKECQHSCYDWETIPMSASAADDIDFQIVMTKSKICRRIDKVDLTETLRQFAMSEKNNNMITIPHEDGSIETGPNPVVHRQFKHIGDFMKNASKDLTQEFWKTIGDVMHGALNTSRRTNKPICLSSHPQDVVMWVYASIDYSLRNYIYAPYKRGIKRNKNFGHI